MLVNDISVDKKMLSEVMGDWSCALKIPVIQRDFVWNAEDVKELIDSIVRGYPIGSIILWETKGEFPSSPLIDTKASLSTPVPLYVLDGQQRLTSLLLLRESWKIKRNGREISIDPISYNPSNKRFYISEKQGIDVSLLVNAALGVPGALEALKEKYHSEYREAIEYVGRKIIRYQLPLYTIKTYSDISGSPEVANEIAEIFTRVNSAGVSLGNIQMFLSFFAAAFSDLKNEIVDRYQKLTKKHDEEFPSWEVVNRFVFSNMKMTQNQITKIDSFKKAIANLKEQYSKNKRKFKEIIGASYVAMDVVLEYVSKETGICTSNRLPSQNTLLPLFRWVYENGVTKYSEISKRNRKSALRWFMIASFNGLYTSYTNRRIEQDLNSVTSGSFPSSILFKNMKKEINTTKIQREDITLPKGEYVKNCIDVTRGNTGRSYLMLLNVLLFRGNASNWAGQPVKSSNTIIHHIFPRDYLRENNITDRNAINDFANITLIDSGINGEIGDTAPSEYLKNYSEKILESHFIPLNEDLWEIDNYENFLVERSKLIWKALEKLLNHDLT
ncbi:MAG: GmrSD restriction endonuclease domain-containing protein [Fervidobacterium sp.]